VFDTLNQVINSVDPAAKEGPAITGAEAALVMVANFFVAVSFSLFLVGLAVGFIQYIISQGDPKAITKAQQAVTWAVVSGFVSIALFAIRTVIMNSIGATDSALVNDVPTF